MKYEKGSLVKLSAQGKKLKQNGDQVGGFGIVTDYIQWAVYPYRVQWFYKKTKSYSTFSAKEYELRRMRAKKSK
jgi:hypothetical protein